MSGGLQKKEDPLIAIPSKLAAADNVEFDDLSTVIMRGGQVKQTLPAGYTTAIRSFVRQGTAQLEFENGATIRANGSTIASDYGAWRGVQYSYEPPTSCALVSAPVECSGIASPLPCLFSTPPMASPTIASLGAKLTM